MKSNFYFSLKHLEEYLKMLRATALEGFRKLFWICQNQNLRKKLLVLSIRQLFSLNPVVVVFQVFHSDVWKFIDLAQKDMQSGEEKNNQKEITGGAIFSETLIDCASLRKSQKAAGSSHSFNIFFSRHHPTEGHLQPATPPLMYVFCSNYLKC